MNLSKKNIYPQVYEKLFLALAFCIPIHSRLVVLVIILIGLFWILEFNFKEKYQRILKSKYSQYMLAFSSVFIIYLLSGFYSENFIGESGTLLKLEAKFSLMVFPLLFSTIDFSHFRKDWIYRTFNAYLTACFIVSVFLINLAVTKYFSTSDTSVFYYIKFADFHHPSYLALYFTFAILILLNRGLLETNRKSSAGIFIIILFFQVMIVLLSSKAGIFGTLICYIAFILYFLIYKKPKRLQLLVTSIIMLFSFGATLFLSPETMGRFRELKEATSETQVQQSDLPPDQPDGSTVRMIVWEISMELIKENPVFGVGIGDVTPLLIERYSEKDFEYLEETKMNAHNQYLQMLLAAGIPGILILLVSFLLPAFYAFKKKQLMYLIFIGIIMLHISVESMFERQGGVVFYSFFNMMLFYYSFVPDSNSPIEG